MSKIEWTDATWNPTLGCSMARGSETGGCLNCYAARMAMRNLWPGEAYARMTKSGPRWTGKVELRPERLDAPLHWRKPRRVFVNSMSDLFHEALIWSDIASVFGVMACAPEHTFQVLTKRPARMLEFGRLMAERNHRAIMATALSAQRVDFHRALQAPNVWPLPNVWLGVSVEDQKTADGRVPLLLQTPAALRFVSYEPALGSVDFASIRADGVEFDALHGFHNREFKIDWLIVGGESGPGARPCDVAWIRSVVQQCRESGVACFVKQLGARYRFNEQTEYADWLCCHIEHPKGGDPAEWPEDLRVRELPR